MKKIVMLLSFLFVITAVNSQTSIRIDHGLISDTLITRFGYTCQKVLQFQMRSVHGVATGYNVATDSIAFNLQFGDGIDTTFKVPLYNDSIFNLLYFNFPFTHHYANSGLINLKLLAIAPDGKKDSIEKNEVIISNQCDSIRGLIYQDANGNCQYNWGEPLWPNMYVKLFYNSHEITNYQYYHNYGGQYNIFAPANYSYDLYASSNLNGVFCPAVRHISNVPTFNNDFGFDCNSGFDLTGNMFGSWFKPGATNAIIRQFIFNYGCSVMNNGKAKLVYDNTILTPTTSNYFYTVSGDTIIWDITNLNSVMGYNNIFDPMIYFNVSTLAQLGDTLCFTQILTPFAGDADTSNNVFTACWPIKNSWDPNDKQVSPQGVSEDGYIENNQNMMYTIRFQNTGNASVDNISIIDTLDSDLEIGTFGIIKSSHYVLANIIGHNTIGFYFDNINLPDSGTNLQASNGYVTFSVHQKPNLAVGTIIKNIGYIYFDYNPAVVTNTTVNTIYDFTTAIGENYSEDNIFIYPNPSTGLINITLTESAKDRRIDVINSFGQVILTKQINTSTPTIDLTNQAKGLYFVKVQSGNGVVVRKVIIE